MRRIVFVLAALAACTPAVNVGTDEDLEGAVCTFVKPPVVDCPAQPWGEQVSFASVSELQQRLVGRWAFCGGELRYSGRGPIDGLVQGEGIEFWSDAGGLRYAFLRGPKEALVRAEDAAGAGTVQLSLDEGRGHAVLRADDGVEAAWTVDFFADRPVLQNSAFDVWNFVAVE